MDEKELDLEEVENDVKEVVATEPAEKTLMDYLDPAKQEELKKRLASLKETLSKVETRVRENILPKQDGDMEPRVEIPNLDTVREKSKREVIETYTLEDLDVLSDTFLKINKSLISDLKMLHEMQLDEEELLEIREIRKVYRDIILKSSIMYRNIIDNVD